MASAGVGLRHSRGVASWWRDRSVGGSGTRISQAGWHRPGSGWDIAEAWHHGGENVRSVEAVLEFGEVAGYMLVADGAVSASEGALDVAEGGIDPLEGRVQGGLATGSSDDRLVDASGGADPSGAAPARTGSCAS